MPRACLILSLVLILSPSIMAETADVRAVRLTLPEDWKVLEPSNEMRALELALPGAEEGDDPLVLVVYYFGAEGAGDTASNVDRWLGQFSQPDGRETAEVAEQTEGEVAGMALLRLRATGTYGGGMGPGAEGGPGFGLRAAILEGPEGPLYFKLVAKEASLARHDEALDAFFKSIELAFRVD